MKHPRCVGWGEIGLDYHYDNTPRELQQAVLTRQLRQAVKLGKPLTIHTREADEDIERILKQEVPKDYKVLYFLNIKPQTVLMRFSLRFIYTVSQIHRNWRSDFLITFQIYLSGLLVRNSLSVNMLINEYLVQA
jgi:Tat protein secretion system quality control protein TatD with DNase activity